MSDPRFPDKRRLLELSIGILIFLVMSVVASCRVLDGFENLFLDMRFKLRGQKPFPQEIRLVAVDEASIDVFGRWPWARDIHAELLGSLKHPSFRPAVLGYDFLFEHKNPNNPAGDERLGFQVRGLEDRVVMAYFFEKGVGASFERNPTREKNLERFALPDSKDFRGIDQADKVSLPFEEISRSALLAFVNTPVEPDGRTRRAQLLMRYNGKVYPSMDLLMALSFLGARIEDVKLLKDGIYIEKSRLGPRLIPLTGEGSLMINYYGAMDRIQSHSFLEVLKTKREWMKGGPAPELLKSFKDKAVLVGVTALGLGDRRVTPYGEYESGIGLHAQVLANILEGDFLRRAPARVSYGAFLVIGLAAIFLTMFLPISRSLLSVTGLGLAYFFAAHAAFLKGLWVDVAVHELTLAVLFIGITSFRYFLALEELRRAQEQLIHAAKMACLGELSAGIVHEFRNILNAINLNVECCMRPGISPEKMTRYADMFRRIMESANMILEGLLTFARKSESLRVPGNLKKTVENTLLLMEKEMIRHQIEVKTELGEVPEIAYDAGQISQVIMNMMNNARDAFKEDAEKQITLRLGVLHDRVCLQIADNGSGIAPEVLKRLFQPFVTTKVAGKGTGLGLSVCHGIIRNHGGDIKVKTAEGQGTTWQIFLPRK